MSFAISVLSEILEAFPNWRPQMYFKSSMTALSHAMEDLVLAGDEEPLVIATFQKERFYKQETQRYKRIAQKSQQVYVLASPETDFANHSGEYEMVAFDSTDALTQEWHLIVIGQTFTSCLSCKERTNYGEQNKLLGTSDNNRRFEGIWTCDRKLSQKAAEILLNRILLYRPELESKIQEAQTKYLQSPKKNSSLTRLESLRINPDPFVERLIAYLQAGQYKLIKANTSLALKEEKERLINSVTAAIRRSLKPEEILQVAVGKLGEGLNICRCLIYRCTEKDPEVKIEYEFLNKQITSLKGETWPLAKNPLFQEIIQSKEPLNIDDAISDPRLIQVQDLVRSWSISAWLVVPILYQGKLLGIVELHQCQDSNPLPWKSEDIILVNAIATQVGVALIQAEAYANLQDLNEQLAALDRTRSNLVAITGHELRTPLSTIQVCLESLATEPDMSLELRQVMLNTALQDAERMRKLIQDFLTLSQLESGRIIWHPEPLSISECVDLALSHLKALSRDKTIPKITNQVPPNLPLVQADGEWLVEVLSKLLDNACKFTEIEGTVTLTVNHYQNNSLLVTIADTGRGIEPNRLETVFDRFYQEEGALRRSAGGTGLGLAICRQIVNGWGGEIWAQSAGKNQGSQFNFTVPIFNTIEIKKN